MIVDVFPGLDLYYKDPAQHLNGGLVSAFVIVSAFVTSES